jgi:pimeloyl-ACP methyl ester carboxylesterase
MLELNTKDYGDPDLPPMVLLHGLFGAKSNWGSVARFLSETYHVVVPDLRNHGQSPHHPEHSYAAMVADLLQLLDAMAIEHATFVGHSMGGKVAMHLALTHPGRAERLAVVDIAPVDYGHDFDQVLAGFRAVDLATIQNRADADRQMAASVGIVGVRAFLLQNLVKGADGWTWRLNLEALENAQMDITGFPQPADGAVYPGPTHFIYGDQSDYVKPAYEDAIERLFPNYTMCAVANAGHWVYAEQPQGFADCIQRFLSDG